MSPGTGAQKDGSMVVAGSVQVTPKAMLWRESYGGHLSLVNQRWGGSKLEAAVLKYW